MKAPRPEIFWSWLGVGLVGVALACLFESVVVFSRRLPFPNADFERGNLTNWMASGDAFANQPTYGDNTLARGASSACHTGRWWVGTFEDRRSPGHPEGGSQGDGPTGRLTSATFTIGKPRLAFLIGGGNNTAATAVELWVEGKKVQVAIGNGSITYSECMRPVVWDVSPWLGKQAYFVIRDEASSGWGHINADDFHYP